MINQIKLLGLDLDGTLLNSKKEISPSSVEILNRLSDQGIHIVIATGRPFLGVESVIANLRNIRYILSSNGARVTDVVTSKILFEHLLEKKYALEALNIFNRYDVIKEVFYDGQGYISQRDYERISRFHVNPNIWEYVRKTRKPVPDLLALVQEDSRNLDKTQGIFRDMDQRKLAWAELEALDRFALVGSLNYNIEINGKGVNKGSSLLSLAETLGIKPQEIMAFGDNDNDTAMLSLVGFGVAMGNAGKPIKEAADYVTVSNDEDGVAKALNKFFG